MNTQRIKLLLLGLPSVSLFLVSCKNLAPTYATPPAPTPQAYKEAPAQFKEGSGWKIAEPGDDKIRPKWWEMYNDPVLSSLEEQVKISNQTIVAAEANYRASQATVLAARSALYPTISTGPSYSNGRSLNTGTAKTLNEFQLPFSGTYTVDLWHRIRNQIAADAALAQASAADIQTALISVQTTLAQDYFELRATDAQRLILQDTLKNYQDALKLTGILYKTGIDSEQDVTQAQVQYDTANAQLTDLGVARAEYEHAIAVLIGKPASSFDIAYGVFAPTPPPVPVALPSTLLERRPDIAALERTVASDNALLGVARAAYYPDLTLTASVGLESLSFTKWFTWPSRFWSLGPGVSQTLWDAGARRAGVVQAEANYDAAVANYRETVLTSFQAVEDQLASARVLANEVVQQQTAVNSSQHYLDLANIRYKTGVDSYLNVITAQNTLLTNRETEVQVQLRQMTTSVQLILALGGGWDKSQLPQQVLPIVPRPNSTLPGGNQPSPASPNYNPAPVPKSAPSS